MGEGPEVGLLGEPTWAEAINRDSGNRQRSKAEAQPGPGFHRQATFAQGLTAVVGAGDYKKVSVGAGCDSHTLPSAAAGLGSSRIEGQPRELRTPSAQNRIRVRTPGWSLPPAHTQRFLNLQENERAGPLDLLRVQGFEMVRASGNAPDPGTHLVRLRL